MAINYTPKFESLYEDISTRIESFYNNGSILTDNKYIVGLYGENVLNALSELSDKASDRTAFKGRNDGIKIPENTYTKMFNRWRETFVSTGFDEVELRWAVNNVKIPIVKPTTDSSFSMDTVKSLWYPIVTGAQKTDTVTLSIVEERGMGFYQFFNALMNQFFTPQVLKPKSSFQKISMYIIILNGEYISSQKDANIKDYVDQLAQGRVIGISKEVKKNIIDIPLQIFEFNSIVPKDISPLVFKQDDKPSKVSFTVTFEAPNLFQGSYKTTTLKGLMDRTTDRTNFNEATDKSELLGRIGDYNANAFTLKSGDLKTPSNGWYD